MSLSTSLTKLVLAELQQAANEECATVCEVSSKTVERFVNKINVSHGCWNWIAHKTRAGYGSFYFRKRMWLAHRVSHVLWIGELGSDVCCHRCDNPSCVNPAHLWRGSQGDNVADMIAKRRHRQGVEKKASVLSESDVIECRRRSALGESYVSIASDLGVTSVTVRSIAQGRKWTHVGGPTCQSNRRSWNRLTANELATLVRMAKAGACANEVARALGRNHGTVTYQGRKLGFFRMRGGSK
jgi:hypothetical protein